jgi:hypothetical protein
MACQGAVQIDAQHSLGLHAAKGRFSIFQLSEQRDTASIIGLTIKGRVHRSRRAIEQPNAEAPFKVLDDIRGGLAGDTDVLGC